MDLVVGLDAGGTASRAVVANLTGEILGRGVAGPGNPLSAAPPGAAVGEIAAALRGALRGIDPTAVVDGVLGIAGTSVLVDPVVRAAFADMWRGLGLRCPVRVVGDLVTAFAGGTAEPSGFVLIAGTGAVAARIEEHEIVRSADGLGWLLGDEGSGRWMGLQALRTAVRTWDSPLASEVAAHTGAATADALVRWAQALPMAGIGALAPVVCAAARDGDAQAAAIVASAAGHLLATLDEVRPAAVHAPIPAPVVLGGGLLVGGSPVQDKVLAALQARDVTAHLSHDPAAAAAWLAARPHSPLSAADLHARLVHRPHA